MPLEEAQHAIGRGDVPLGVARPQRPDSRFDACALQRPELRRALRFRLGELFQCPLDHLARRFSRDAQGPADLVERLLRPCAVPWRPHGAPERESDGVAQGCSCGSSSLLTVIATALAATLVPRYDD